LAEMQRKKDSPTNLKKRKTPENVQTGRSKKNPTPKNPEMGGGDSRCIPIKTNVEERRGESTSLTVPLGRKGKRRHREKALGVAGARKKW